MKYLPDNLKERLGVENPSAFDLMNIDKNISRGEVAGCATLNIYAPSHSAKPVTCQLSKLRNGLARHFAHENPNKRAHYEI